MNNVLARKNWGTVGKVIARESTIIKTYREIYNKDIMHPEAQYWSMCGRCATLDGSIVENCEPFQMVNSGLIKPCQFHGVELDESSSKLNDLINDDFNFYHDDFLRAMRKKQLQQRFSPAIVNADFIKSPQKITESFAQILNFLTEYEHKNCMLIGNFVLSHRNNVFATPENISDELNNFAMFKVSFIKGNWKFYPKSYSYAGNATQMCTVILFN